MVRAILLFIVICFFAQCKRDWTNVWIEKRVYRSGYYFHVPDKKYTPQQAYIPPAPFPVAYNGPVMNKPVSTDTTQPPLPVYVSTNVPNDTGTTSVGFAVIGGNDSVPPTQGWMAGAPAPQDSAVGQVITPADTVNAVVQNDTSVNDTIAPVIAKTDPKKKIQLNGEADGFFQLGMIAGPESEGYPVKLNSYSMAFGARFKIKVCSRDKLVLDLGYRNYRFAIAQDEPKAFPINSGVHDRERISMHSFTMGFSNRFIYRHGEKQLPYWLDLGVYGDAAFRTSNVYVNKTNDASSPVSDISEVTTRNVHLNYLRKFNYGLTVRAGFKNYSCFAHYRLSDLMKPIGENPGDLPRFVIGIELNFGESK